MGFNAFARCSISLRANRMPILKKRKS
jgi:hypothetical protein